MKRFRSYSRPLTWLSALLVAALISGCGGGQDPILGGVSVVLVPPAGAIAPGAACPVAGATIPTVISTEPTNANQFVTTSTSGVAGGGKLITATFSLAMAPATINSATFALAPTGSAALIPASVTYDDATRVATLTTSSALLANTSYTAVILPGATSASGVPMGCSYAWSFRTAATAATGVAPANLRSASTFGTFGGSAGMTNQGTLTVVNGDIGTTAVSTAVTGFHDLSVAYSPPPAATGCSYTETTLNIGTVNGRIYTAPPPPTVSCPNEGTAATLAIATQARADALSAYNALVALPGGLDVATCAGCGGGGAGELGSRTLAPGVYRSAPGSYAITLGNLTLDAQGDANAVWVFQMATSLTVGIAGPTGARSVILTNGAQAKNVFWQVGSAATINAAGGGTMVGTIITQSGATFSTAGNTALVTLNGRVISLGASVTLVNTVINVPAP